MRWKLEIQEYDCDVRYIKGPENYIADAFSRLCDVTSEDPNDEENIECLNGIEIDF
jgi:hypothetical protein